MRGGAGGGVRVDGQYNLGMVQSEEDSEHSDAGRCQLCGRLLGENRLTRHHLLPRSRARKMKPRARLPTPSKVHF